MGLSTRPLEALLYLTQSRQLGRSVMIGRQSFGIPTRKLRQIFRTFGRPLTEQQAEKLLATKFAEPLFLHLGASSIDSIDASGYEGANLVADLNRPIPEQWLGQYDLVADFGTLEHVFNFPIAIENCLGLLRPGGVFISIGAGNNFCGHGFYQFSPELWHRLLRANHYENIRLFAATSRTAPPWYRVPDPIEVRGRVNLITAEQLFLVVIATKTELSPAALAAPQQSDYEDLRWAGQSAKQYRAPLSNRIGRAARSTISQLVKPFGRRFIPVTGVSDHSLLSVVDLVQERYPKSAAVASAHTDS